MRQKTRISVLKSISESCKRDIAAPYVNIFFASPTDVHGSIYPLLMFMSASISLFVLGQFFSELIQVAK